MTILKHIPSPTVPPALPRRTNMKRYQTLESLPSSQPCLNILSQLVLTLFTVTHIRSRQKLANQPRGQVAYVRLELGSLNTDQHLQLTTDGSWYGFSRASRLQFISSSLNRVPEPLTPGTLKSSVRIYRPGKEKT